MVVRARHGDGYVAVDVAQQGHTIESKREGRSTFAVH